MQANNAASLSKLPAVLDLAAAGGLLDSLRSRLAATPELRLDASEVETLTLPCLQILLAARRCYGGVSIERPSTAFVDAIEDFGLSCRELCDAESGVAEPAATVDQRHTQAETTTMARRILTIDDSKTIRDMLMLTLTDAGFDVLQAVDGQHGLEVLGKEQVDLVITDINMPRMDGYEVIRRMRSDSTHKTTPILVLTTESEAEKKNTARLAGATGWIVKPFDPDRLVATINKVAR